MSEKIVVEFDVEKTIEREYGYQEKLLKYKGSDTKYKGIVKDGKLIAILGRGYKLIPNEAVEAEIKRLQNFSVSEKAEKWRKYWLLEKEGEYVAVLVVNSVDGSEALKVIACIPSEHSILVGSKLQNVYRRHTPKADLSDLGEIIDEMMNTAVGYKQWLAKLDLVEAEDNIEVLEMLAEEMPKKYVEKALATAKAGQTLGGSKFTLKMFYECVAKKIWNAEVDMRTKVRLYRLLNDCMFSIVEWEG